MKYLRIIIFMFILTSTNYISIAQQTIIDRKDSANPYKNIEVYNKSSKFVKFMYRFFYKSIVIKSPKKKVNKIKLQKPYSNFDKKFIKHIIIVVLDPFATSIADTVITRQNILSKTGNTLHIKSKAIAISNLLLIKQNQVFDSLLLKESERLLRSKSYIRDLEFYVVAVKKQPDSVDIYIRVLDNWSLITDSYLTSLAYNLNLTDMNLLGNGNQLQFAFNRDFNKNINDYNTNYSIPNFKNTYISTSLHYDFDDYGNFNKSISIERNFYSPYTKIAGGIILESELKKDSLKDFDNKNIPFNLKFNTQDVWLGKAFRIFKGNTENDRATSFIIAGNYQKIIYLEKPLNIYDSLFFYNTQDFFLTGIGISTRKYLQDKFIFKFGLVEDVPIGSVYGITSGFQISSSKPRLYVGLRYSLGNYYCFGYLSWNIEYGTFINSRKTQQGAVNFSINYFTNLLEIGRFKFRQFIKPQLTIGINRLGVEKLSLNDDCGINGFNSTSLYGNNRLLLTFQTQSYLPYNFIGFRFGPYFICSLGMLDNSKKSFNKSRLYSQFGFGILIKNEYIVFNTFQFSISFYPIIPAIGQDVFKTNSYKTTDFGFRNFEFGKPAVVEYK